MPKVDLNEALEEWEEAQATERDIDNLLAYGTDDLKRVAELEAQMREDSLRLERELDRQDWEDFWDSYFEDGRLTSLACPANQPVDPMGLDWEEDDEWSYLDFD
jgi:hypothetical protein